MAVTSGGVPVHVMEVVGCPAEGTPERNQTLKVLNVRHKCYEYAVIVLFHSTIFR